MTGRRGAIDPNPHKEEAVDHEPADGAVASLDLQADIGSTPIRTGQLDLEHRVGGGARAGAIGHRARLGVAVDDDGIRNGRQLGGGRDGVGTSARDVEGDRVRAGHRVRLLNRRPQGAFARGRGLAHAVRRVGVASVTGGVDRDVLGETQARKEEVRRPDVAAEVSGSKHAYDDEDVEETA